MVNYRRNKPDSPDSIFFLTLVTRNRFNLFETTDICEIALQEMKRMVDRFKLKYTGWAILPDHIHWLIKTNGADYSKVVYSFKRNIGAELKRKGVISDGDQIWQPRFWEHTVIDEKDNRKSLEYIHFNPVKHGLCASPSEWKYSSFAKYVERGIYPVDWAKGEDIDVVGSEYD